MSLTFQPTAVNVGEGAEGQLVFQEGELVAVLVRLSSLHGAQEGCWFLEAGFGPLDVPNPPVFTELAAAGQWVEARLAAYAAMRRR